MRRHLRLAIGLILLCVLAANVAAESEFDRRIDSDRAILRHKVIIGLGQDFGTQFILNIDGLEVVGRHILSVPNFVGLTSRDQDSSCILQYLTDTELSADQLQSMIANNLASPLAAILQSDLAKGAECVVTFVSLNEAEPNSFVLVAFPVRRIGQPFRTSGLIAAPLSGEPTSWGMIPVTAIEGQYSPHNARPFWDTEVLSMLTAELSASMSVRAINGDAVVYQSSLDEPYVYLARVREAVQKFQICSIEEVQSRLASATWILKQIEGLTNENIADMIGGDDNIKSLDFDPNGYFFC